MSVHRLLIVLNVLDKTNRFKDCSFNITELPPFVSFFQITER